VHVLVMEAGTSRPRIDQQLGNGVDRDPRDPADRPHGRPLAEQVEDLDAGLKGQLVHAPSI
jgi:hypothetical protein